MRTTMTLDSDVAAMLARRQAMDLTVSFKELVNGMLRFAFAHQGCVRNERRRRSYTKVFTGRKVMFDPTIASTSDLLDIAEGDVRL